VMRSEITSPMKQLFILAVIGLLAGGCASTSDSGSKPASAATTSGDGYTKDKDIQRVWLAPGFDFSGYDTLYIGPAKYAAKERPNEVDMRTWAIKYLTTAYADRIGTNKLFANVTTREDDPKPGSKVLRMENTIYEYEKGGGGARYFVGLYGGGQPVIKVRGQFTDGEKTVCKYEAWRSGESAGSRLAGVFMSDQNIQQDDINDLALDMSDFMLRTSRHVKK